MPYLQQKDSTWQTRRSSSSFTRFTRSRRRQLLGVFSVLCILIYWTVCIGLGSTRNELFTPPLPATPKFWAGGSEDRLVTIQTSKGAFVTDLGDVVEPPASQEIPRPQIFNQVASSEEPILQERPATIQVTKGSSVNDIGDVEEQQSLAEDVSEMQPVVADGGRLTDISKSQAATQADNSQDPASISVQGAMTDKVKSAAGLLSPTTVSPGYVFPDTSNFERLNRLADELPDYVHIPLHMAVQEETLDSWEEDWFAHAVFEPKTHGSLKEPKIDFVYTCKF